MDLQIQLTDSSSNHLAINSILPTYVHKSSLNNGFRLFPNLLIYLTLLVTMPEVKDTFPN